MKKFFIFAAMAGAVLVSCTKNEPAATNNEQLITFAAPVVSLNTRSATEVWNNYPTGKAYDFAVWAKYFVDANYSNGTYTTWDAGQTYMEEVLVSYNATDKTWAPASNYYWPKNGSLTFIGYAPASKASYASVTDKGIVFTDYEVSATPSKQVDLLFSERTYNQKVSNMDNTSGDKVTGNTGAVKDDIYEGIHISFKHALSSILFNIKTADDYTASTTITLQGITVQGAVTTATFNQNLNDANGAVTTAAAWDTNDNGNGPSEDYPVDITVDQEITTTPYYPSGITKETAATNGVRATDLILLPQNLDGVSVKINYTINNIGEGSLDDDGNTDPSEPLTQIAELPLGTTNVPAWEMGKRYIYNIVIGLDKITFEPYVQDWVNVDMPVQYI